MTASNRTYIETGSRVPRGVFLDNVFNQVLRLGCQSSCDEVVTIFEETLLSFVKRTIARYPIMNTLVVAHWHFW